MVENARIEKSKYDIFKQREWEERRFTNAVAFFISKESFVTIFTLDSGISNFAGAGAIVVGATGRF